MKIIPLTYQILLETLSKQRSFSSSLKKAFKDNQIVKENKIACKKIVTVALKHHLLINNYLTKTFGELPLEVCAAIELLIVSKLYTHTFDEKEITKFVKGIYEKLGEETSSKIKNTLDNLKEKKDLTIISDNKIENLSNRFNIPYWVGKTWCKHYSINIAYNQMKACFAPKKCFVSFYDKYTVVDESLFQKTSIDNIYLYLGKENIKSTKEYRQGWLYIANPVFKEIFSLVDIEPIRGLAIYSGFSSSLLNDLYSIYGNSIRLDYLVTGMNNFINHKEVMEALNFSNIGLYDTPYDALSTCISNKVNTFIVCPKSSDLNRLHTDADYFLNLDSQEMDENIKQEKVLLEKASALVENYGKIIYIIPTANKKESRGVLEDFLSSHKDFSLLIEKQYLFFDEFDCSYYYAIIERVNND